MTSPIWSSLLDLYQQTVCVGVVQYLEKQTGVRRNRGIYSAAVVLWLMMLQRLEGRGTLASAVQMLLEGAAEPLAFPLPPGAAETDFCAGPAAIAKPGRNCRSYYAEAGEPDVNWSSDCARCCELLSTAGVGQRVCAGWFFAGTGT